MALIVKKFGGSSVATPDKMRAIVQRVLKGKQEGDKIVIVVSAMGDTTDELVSLAKQITSKAYGREMDMLLSTGEQVSIALMAMAFQEAGQKAISFTGAQAGIKTSDAFNKGRILELEPRRRRRVPGHYGPRRYYDLGPRRLGYDGCRHCRRDQRRRVRNLYGRRRRIYVGPPRRSQRAENEGNHVWRNAGNGKARRRRHAAPGR